MIVVSTQIEEGKSRVHSVYTDDTLISNVDINEVPPPKNDPGKIPVLYFNPETKEFFHEYEDNPLSPIEDMLKRENEELRAQQELMQAALDELLLGGGL